MLLPRCGKRLAHGGTILAWLVAMFVAQAVAQHTAAPKIYTAEQLNDQVGDGISISISIMLIGSISFMMMLFYLVNSEDDDIKRYAWKVVSATISIFCAVLLFQACNGLVEEYLIKGGMKAFGMEEESSVAKIWESVVDIVQLVFWLTMMQLTLALTSGAISEQLPDWIWQPEDMEASEIATKSFAVLLAHISGFAALNGWGSIQQSLLGHNPATAILIVPIGICGLQGLYFVFNQVREGVSLGDDGVVDEKEAAWDEETEDAENDVAGLSMSFLTVQVIRFWIGGALPDEEGKEPHVLAFNHSSGECHMLCLCGLFFLAGLCTILHLRGKLPPSPAELEADEDLTEEEAEEAEVNYKAKEHIIRPLLILVVYFSCGMAWCFFYGCYWTVAATGWTDQDAMLQVIIAIFISGISFSVIWMFDKIEDSGVLGEAAGKAIDATIDALGILIGFSWEQGFDVAVDVISEDVDKYVPKTFARLIMSMMLTAIVFPAWKGYILPTELELFEEATGKGQKKKLFRDKLEKLHNHFLEGKTSERDLDHAHLALKIHRRKHHGKMITPYKDEEKPLKHMLLTAAGLADVPEDDEMLTEKLLPECLQEPKEDDEQSRWGVALDRIRVLLGKPPSGGREEKEEA